MERRQAPLRDGWQPVFYHSSDCSKWDWELSGVRAEEGSQSSNWIYSFTGCAEIPNFGFYLFLRCILFGLVICLTRCRHLQSVKNNILVACTHVALVKRSFVLNFALIQVQSTFPSTDRHIPHISDVHVSSVCYNNVDNPKLFLSRSSWAEILNILGKKLIHFLGPVTSWSFCWLTGEK